VRSRPPVDFCRVSSLGTKKPGTAIHGTFPREYRGTQGRREIWIVITRNVNGDFVRATIESNAACLFFGLRRSLRTTTSIVADHRSKSRTRSRTFGLAALHRDVNSVQRKRRTDRARLDSHCLLSKSMSERSVPSLAQSNEDSRVLQEPE